MTGLNATTPLNPVLQNANEVSELSCASSDYSYSEASSLFMAETDWQFEEDIDCNTTITKDEDDFHPFPLSDDPIYQINDETLVGGNSFTALNRNAASHNDIHYSFFPEKWNESSKQSEDICGTQITEEQGRNTVSLTFSILEYKVDDPDPSKDYQDRCSAKVRNPMIMSKRSNSEKSASSLECLSSQTLSEARNILGMTPQMLNASNSSTSRHYSLDGTTNVSYRRTSLDSQTIVDKSTLVNQATNLGCCRSSFLENKNLATKYSEAAQRLLGEPDNPNASEKISESIHPKTASAAMPQTAEDRQTPTESDLSVVHEKNYGTCDDVIDNVCNGLAQGTLYACHIFMSMFERKDEEETDAPEEGTIEIPEEKGEIEPTPILIVVPQVVRKGHILPHIVKNDEGKPLFLSQQQLQKETCEESTIPSPMSGRSPLEEEKIEGNEEDSSFIVLYGQPHVLCETRKKGFPKSTDDAFDFADADACSSFLEPSHVLPQTLLQ